MGKGLSEGLRSLRGLGAGNQVVGGVGGGTVGGDGVGSGSMGGSMGSGMGSGGMGSGGMGSGGMGSGGMGGGSMGGGGLGGGGAGGGLEESSDSSSCAEIGGIRIAGDAAPSLGGGLPAVVELRPWMVGDAPELRKRTSAAPSELLACDVWGLGVLLMSMLTGRAAEPSLEQSSALDALRQLAIVEGDTPPTQTPTQTQTQTQTPAPAPAPAPGEGASRQQQPHAADGLGADHQGRDRSLSASGAQAPNLATALAKLSAEMLTTCPASRPSAADVLARLRALASATGNLSMGAALEEVHESDERGMSFSPAYDGEDEESTPGDVECT